MNMFTKNFRIKSNTAIRGSDRRKLRADVLREFPFITQESASDIIPNKDDMTVMKIMTHSGQNVTAYILNGAPIFFQVEAKLYPTVYLLWKYPNMLPSFTTWPNVFEKIQRGADLMLPGVILSNDSVDNLIEFQKGEACSVTLLGNRAPVAVGYTAVSSCEAIEQGMRGKGVIILHSYLDNLWSQGTKIEIPVVELTSCVDTSKSSEASKIDNNVEIKKTNKDSMAAIVDENHQTLNSVTESENADVETATLNNKVAESNLVDSICVLDEEFECSETLNVLSSKEVDNDDVSSRREHSTAEVSTHVTTDNLNATVLESVNTSQELMDKLLETCFMRALLKTKNDDLPILTSTFYKNSLLPCCPHNQTLDIKKSGYKKLTRFLQVMETKGLITIKEESKGVHTIECINWDHGDFRNFKKENKSLLQGKPYSDQELNVDNKYQPPEIEELLAVSGATQALFQLCGYTKGAVLSAKEVRHIVTDYIKSQELVSSQNRRMVVLNPVLFSVVHNKGEGNIDHLSWDEVFSRIIDRMNPCHKVTFKGRPPLTRKGKLKSIEIKVQQRMGNKKVTLVHNLEYYGIDPAEFAHKLQLKAASSTAVSQLPGKNNPGQQVLIQGNQVQHVGMTLQDDYQVANKYINGLHKPKQSGRKK